MLAGAKAKRDIVSHDEDDIVSQGEYQGVHRGRQVDIAKKLFAVMGIVRDDKPMRQDWVLRCVAMGYPDDSFPANAVRSDRESNGDFVRYVGFAD